MATCDVCGNDYDKAFRITQAGKTMTFDRFECAIHAMAPRCAHCQCPAIGHGVQDGGTIYCCAHCAGIGGQRGQRQGGLATAKAATAEAAINPARNP
jgi:nitrite reductase/ring-hydroxylating ferredoxin subunit